MIGNGARRLVRRVWVADQLVEERLLHEVALLAAHRHDGDDAPLGVDLDLVSGVVGHGGVTPSRFSLGVRKVDLSMRVHPRDKPEGKQGFGSVERASMELGRSSSEGVVQTHKNWLCTARNYLAPEASCACTRSKNGLMGCMFHSAPLSDHSFRSSSSLASEATSSPRYAFNSAEPAASNRAMYADTAASKV